MNAQIILSAEDSDADFLLIQLATRQAESCIQLCRVLNGEEAIDFLKRVGGYKHAPRPDFILLDGNMPRKDGFQVLEQIKRDDSLNTIPVVMLSSSTNERDKQRALELGAAGFISKSLDLDTFVSNLRRSFASFH